MLGSDLVDRACSLEACQSRVERTEGKAREKAEILAHPLTQVVAVHGVFLQQPQDRQLEHAANISRRHIKAICRVMRSFRCRSSCKAAGSRHELLAPVGDRAPLKWRKPPLGSRERTVKARAVGTVAWPGCRASGAARSRVGESADFRVPAVSSTDSCASRL